MKITEVLIKAGQLNASYEVLKKLKDIFEDTFDGITIPSTGNDVMSYIELCHFRDMNIKYLDKRIKKIEKEIEKLEAEEEQDDKA